MRLVIGFEVIIKASIEFALVTLGLVTDVHVGHAGWHRAIGNTLLATDQTPVEYFGSGLVVSSCYNVVSQLRNAKIREIVQIITSIWFFQSFFNSILALLMAKTTLSTHSVFM